jgi:DNA-binding transcriptional LysR family regulator
MDITFMKTFLDVARTHNFTQSADRLGYAQSSVTAQIQKLEAAYGSPLFERLGKKMNLTQAGEELYQYASQIVQLYEESLVAVKRPCAGSLTIGTFETTLMSYLLPPYFGEFKKAYPQMNIALQEAGENDLLRMIRAGECDIGMLVGPAEPEPDIVFEQVREEEYVIIAPPDHPLAMRERIAPSDFGPEDVIMTNPNCGCRNMWVSFLRSHNIDYRVASEISSLETVKNCVVLGIGISLVPRSIVGRDRELGKLAVLLVDGLEIRRPLYVVYHNRKRISPPMRHFIESLRN